MGPSTPSALPLTPLAAPLPEGRDIQALQLETSSEAAPEYAGLFALLLGQLTTEEPAVQPVAPAAPPGFATLATEIAGELLPETGNLLPPSLDTLTVDDPALSIAALPTDTGLTAELTDVVVADTAQQAAILPLPALPQPVQITPDSASALTRQATTASLTAATSPANTIEQPVQPQSVSNELVNAARPEPVIARELLPLKTQQATQQTVTAAIPESPAPLVSTNTLSGSTSAAPLVTTAPQAYTLNHSMADPRWGESLGQRVVWMTDNGIGRADIRLNPRELGPIEVRIAVANDEARVAFNVQHGATREAIESAMPRLREMFAQQGITLADASVSQHSPGEERNAGNTDTQSNQRGIDGVMTADDTDAGNVTATVMSDGLIDTYA